MVSHSALAQISADHRTGAVVIGAASDTCNSGIEGALRYNTTGKVFEYCNGTAWGSLSGAGTLASAAGVQITNPQDGQAFVYNSSITKWVNNVCDTMPNTFTFTDLTQQARSTLLTSNIVQISGISCSADVYLTGEGVPEYRICSDASCSSVVTNWTRTQYPIINNQYVQMRMNTSVSPGVMFTATLNAGSGSDAWSVTTAPRKKVFVTSSFYNGNLGGLSGGDTKCQTLADAASLGGTYKAWLSDGTTSAASRLTQSATGYQLVNGTKVADSWADLTDGTIDAMINVTQANNPMLGAAVWTNTNTSGGVMGTNHCTNWTSSSSGVNGQEGSTGWADNDWTDYTWNSCNQSKRLYCFEQ